MNKIIIITTIIIIITTTTTTTTTPYCSWAVTRWQQSLHWYRQNKWE